MLKHGYNEIVVDFFFLFSLQNFKNKKKVFDYNSFFCIFGVYLNPVYLEQRIINTTTTSILKSLKDIQFNCNSLSKQVAQISNHNILIKIKWKQKSKRRR